MKCKVDRSRSRLVSLVMLNCKPQFTSPKQQRFIPQGYVKVALSKLLLKERLDCRHINPKGIGNCVIAAINGGRGRRRKRIKKILFIYIYIAAYLTIM